MGRIPGWLRRHHGFLWSSFANPMRNLFRPATRWDWHGMLADMA